MFGRSGNKVLCRAAALLLCACLLASVGVAPVSRANADTPAARLTGPTQYAVNRVADPDTTDSYNNKLLSDANGSRYAGRLWMDKTVFAYANGDHTIRLDTQTDGLDTSVEFNADFAHVFSALASSQVVNEYPPSPIDLVIVFDMSGSMGQDTRYGIDMGMSIYVDHNPANDNSVDEEGRPLKWPEEGVLMADRIAHSRIQATLNAINNTIAMLMNQNPQNRVAVCGYGANAVVLMPLAHYRRVNVNGVEQPYLSVGGMETLYHPSDLVYRTVGDKLLKNNNELPGVNQDGWYWMNNRDTCYTVVVNAEMNTYTGVLDEDGSGASHGASWTSLHKTVSNNVLSDDGEQVKAFPGAWKDEKTPGTDYAELSRKIYQSSSADVNAWASGMENAANHEIGLRAEFFYNEDNLGVSGLKAEDYVGYFTNTQGGIYLAYKQLADSRETTYTEQLSNGMPSTVARIPAAIIMSDGGANFAFNEMGGDPEGTYTADDWNVRYGQLDKNSFAQTAYFGDDSWTALQSLSWGDGMKDGRKLLEGRYLDIHHRIGGVDVEDKASGAKQDGDEWYKVYLPGKDTLGDKWDGLHGLYNLGADRFIDGTLCSQPSWSYPGVFYSSDNNVAGTAGTVMEVLLTASYMSEVVKKHYAQGWVKNNASEDSQKNNLSTYTMNVDTEHVPLWGKMRLYPTLNPKEYHLDNIDAWVDDPKNVGKFGTDEEIQKLSQFTKNLTRDILFKGGRINGNENEIKGLAMVWEEFKKGIRTAGPNEIAEDGSSSVDIVMEPIPAGGVTYMAGGGDTVQVTNEEVVNNIAYNDEFYDVTSAELENIFDTILALILGKVFVPVSGGNDAGVEDSLTYQDPIGEYMEIKNQSIHTATHANPTADDYDMSLLLFGEMHGLVRTGVYDYQWASAYLASHGLSTFTPGWYRGVAEKAETPKNGTATDGSGSYPAGYGYTCAEDAWEDGWTLYLNAETLAEYVPIVNYDPSLPTSEWEDQIKNTVYTVYRFAGTTQERNALHINPVFGTKVPETVQNAWNQYYADYHSYPVGNDLYAGTPGVFRVSDIRVWVEDTGDFVDTSGTLTPETSGYSSSLYLNLPAAAIPTQLATITMGKSGVLSYKTNLSDKRQSTPVRLFYTVGLEEDLILREDGEQVGVDISALAEEYVAEHTTPESNVWFISNYYSNTAYSGYVSDSAATRTRGDPATSFSPGEDNRYYVFQKALPLYAHAYRVTEDGAGKVSLLPVDRDDDHIWTADENRRGGNGATEWETYGGVQQAAGTWDGGLYMGTYDGENGFQTAYAKAKESGKGTITDANNAQYEVVKDGIVFLRDDLLTHVTSDASGGYAEGSVSFSSDDYFFILIDYFLPDPAHKGVDDKGKELEGTYAGRAVQQVVARVGSAFGSAFQSNLIDNGSMLCWTDISGEAGVNLTYFSKSLTGDNTRGEPTYEKLFCDEKELEKVLKACGVSEKLMVDAPTEGQPDRKITALQQQLDYWKAVRADEQVKSLIDEIKAEKTSEAERKDLFAQKCQWAVAARQGGIRTGDMAQNRGAKSNNTTSTAYNYYLPTVSENSGTGNAVMIDCYLGNNGRLEVGNDSLLVTKRFVNPDGSELTDDQKRESFQYQVYVYGVTGERNATRVIYNPYSQTWQPEINTIDVLTDNSNLLLDTAGQRALFDRSEEPTGTVDGQQIYSGRYVVAGADGNYYYANEDGTASEEKCQKELTGLYYIYLPDNTGSVLGDDNSRRIYEDKGDGSVALPENAGRTTYYNAGIPEPEQETPRDTFSEENAVCPAGTQTYWVLDAEMIPVKQVQDAEGVEGILLDNAGGEWHHDDSAGDEHAHMRYLNLVAVYPDADGSSTRTVSPFKTRTQLLTEKLTFGIPESELYDGIIPRGDRPDLFGSATNSAIAHNTASFELKSGEGLLLTGLANRIAYRFTEKLTEEQLNKGYTLQEVSHVQQRGSDSVYRPGIQEIPVYHYDGATYGDNYKGYENALTENGLTWALDQNGNPNKSAYRTYEPFNHANAVLWEYYATLGQNELGNHHHPVGAAREEAEFYNQSTQTGDTLEVLPNPSCATCDEIQVLDKEKGTFQYVHYMYKAGRLVDPHYDGEASAFLRNMSRFLVSTTAHFAVKGETQTAAEGKPPVTPSEAYTGVYSVFGNTGFYEEKANFINTYKRGELSIAKEVTGENGGTLSEADLKAAFAFTLRIDPAVPALAATNVYDYTLTDAQGGLVSGRLLPPSGVAAEENDLTADADGAWRFTLRDGDIMTVTRLPEHTGYAYTVSERSAEGFVTSHNGGGSDPYTVSGTVKADDTQTIRVRFVNTRLLRGDLTVAKTVTGEGGDTNAGFHFRVDLSEPLNGRYGEMDFENGVALFTLRHGEKKTATGLPANVDYEISETEENKDGYVTTVTGKTGMIPVDGAVTAVFTNHRDPEPGNLSVTKTVTGVSGERTREFHFRVELSQAVNGTYGDMTFVEGVAAVTLKHNETKTATGLPYGITYTVTELEANKDGYKTTETNAKGTVPAGGTVQAGFINDRNTTTPPPDIPQTGDRTPLGPLTVVALLSLGALAVLLGARKKKRN